MVRSALRRSILAQRSVNLRGQQVEMILGADGNMRTTTRRVVESADGRSLAITLTPSAERGNVKLIDAELTRAYNLRQKAIYITRSMPRIKDDHDVERQIRRITGNYDVRLVSDVSIIAGRACQILELHPLNTISHIVQVWVDKANGAVLSRTESDHKGNTIASSFYTSISFPPRISDTDVTYRFPRYARRVKMSLSPLYRDIASLRHAAGFDVYLPTAMPAGFEMDASEIVRLNNERVVCLRFSDGITNITICQNPTKQTPAGYSAILWQPLPRGQAMVLRYYRRSVLMIAGPKNIDVLCWVAGRVDADRERSLLERLSNGSGMPLSELAEIRNRGMMLDALAALSEISTQSRRRFDVLVGLYRDGWTWPRIAEQCKASIQRVRERIGVYR